MSQPEARHIAALSQLLINAFAQANPTCAGLPVIVPASPAELDHRQWYLQAFDGLPDLQLFVGVLEGTDETDTANRAVMERLGAFFAAFAKLLSKTVGSKVASLALESVNLDPESVSDLLLVRDEDIGSGLFVAISAEGAEWLANNIPAVEPAQPAYSPVLDALMDVELPVSVLLASKEIPLREVMNWGAGTIVDFEADLGDPVDVIVNGQVVARGSVVLVDGNYGVRVTKVLASNGMMDAAV